MSKFSLKRVAFIALMFCGFSCAPLFAQGDRGVVTGKVADAQGGVIPGAQVQLIDDASKVVLKTKSDQGGAYSFPSVVPGKYTIVVNVQGFMAFRVEHIQVDLGIPTQIDASMQIGKVNETVTVQGQAQQLAYDSADLGLVVEEKSMTDLPLVYGNAFSLENLAPGVTLSGVDPNIHVYDSGTSNVSVNGSMYNSIDYKLDGAADNRIRTTAFTPNTESISQYRLTTSSYDTSQGHASGGFTNVQTKSGTDHFHGSLFGYYQNPNINANKWTLPGTRVQTKPTFVREGFSFGGPLWRGKLFFFTGFEHSRQTNPNNGSVNIPTQAQVNGDFSALLALDKSANAGNVCGSTPTVLNGTPNGYQLFDPRTSGAGRLCIPGNNVAKYAGGIDPVAKNILKYYPKESSVSSAGVGVYNYALGNKDNYSGGILRLDYAINPRQQMFIHALRSSRYSQPALVFAPVSTAYLSYDNWGLAVGHTIAVSPSLVVSSTASYSRFRDNNQNPVEGQVTPTTLGMPAYLVNGLPHSAAAFPRFDLTGYQSLNTASDYFGADDTWLGNVSVSKQLRTHFLRAGFEYRRYITSGESGGTENGSYTSKGDYATQSYSNNTAAGTAGGIGFSVAQLEMGILSSGSQNQNSDYFTRSHYFAAYLQDDWRATNRLTVNVGLRWERETPMEELNGKDIVSFNFDATNAVTNTGAANYAAMGALTVGAGTTEPITLPSQIRPIGGAVFANTNGFGLSPYNAQAYQWGPRAGLSYAFYPSLVLHAGFGIFYDSLQTYYLSSVNSGSTTTVTLAQQGYSQSTSIVAPSDTGVVTSTLDNPFPFGLTPVSGNRNGVNTALGNDIQFLTPNPHTPYNERWNLGLQQQFGQFAISLSYVGNRGVHTPTAQSSMGTNYGGRDYNAVPVKYLSPVQGGLDQVANKTTLGASVTNPFYQNVPSSTSYLSSATTSVAQLLRPRPEFGRINSYTFDGSAFYNSLQVQVQRRFTKGLSTTQAFTWSKSMDSTTFLNPGDVKPWHGLSSTDRPLRYSGSVIYQLPWGRDRRWLSTSHSVLAQVVGGWQVQGVYQVQSGGPLNFGNIVYRFGDPSNSAWSRKDYKATQRLGIPGTPYGGYWFNPKDYLVTAAIEATLPNQFQSTANTAAVCMASLAFCPTGEPSGNQLRTFPIRFSGLRSDNLNQADVGIQRQFQVWKLGTLQFRAEAINVLNHPVYSAPSVDPTNASFAQITAQANSARVFQFAAFFRF